MKLDPWDHTTNWCVGFTIDTIRTYDGGQMASKSQQRLFNCIVLLTPRISVGDQYTLYVVRRPKIDVPPRVRVWAACTRATGWYVTELWIWIAVNSKVWRVIQSIAIINATLRCWSTECCVPEGCKRTLTSMSARQSIDIFMVPGEDVLTLANINPLLAEFLSLAVCRSYRF